QSRLVVEGVTETQGARRIGQAGHELVAHRLPDRNALARVAALPRAEVAADDRALDRLADVGVREHHLRAVAAELEHHMLARCSLRHRRAGLGRADKAHAVHKWMTRDLVAYLGAGSRDEVDGASWKIAFCQALHQRDGDDARG